MTLSPAQLAIIELDRKHGLCETVYQDIARVIDMFVEEERERCAQIADMAVENPIPERSTMARHIAAEIRANSVRYRTQVKDRKWTLCTHEPTHQ